MHDEEQILYCEECGHLTPHRVQSDEEGGAMAMCRKCGHVHSLSSRSGDAGWSEHCSGQTED